MSSNSPVGAEYFKIVDARHQKSRQWEKAVGKDHFVQLLTLNVGIATAVPPSPRGEGLGMREKRL